MWSDLEVPSGGQRRPRQQRCLKEGFFSSADMARLQSMQRVIYAVTAAVPGHRLSRTDASNRRIQFLGLLYSCLKPVSTSFSSPGRHNTQARCSSRGVPFPFFLKNL